MWVMSTRTSAVSSTTQGASAWMTLVTPIGSNSGIAICWGFTPAKVELQASGGSTTSASGCIAASGSPVTEPSGPSKGAPSPSVPGEQVAGTSSGAWQYLSVPQLVPSGHTS